MSHILQKRAVFLFVPPRGSRNPVFLAPLVIDRKVKVKNLGPGAVGVTKSVSANGINFTILPGVTTVGPGRVARIQLPVSAIFVKLTVSSLGLPATVVLAWRQKIVRFLVNPV